METTHQLGLIQSNFGGTCSAVNFCVSITATHCFVPSVLWCCWLGGRKGIQSVKKPSGGVLAWLYVWSELQTCIWPSWCHCHSLSQPSNGCVCVCVSQLHKNDLLWPIYKVLVDLLQCFLIAPGQFHLLPQPRWESRSFNCLYVQITNTCRNGPQPINTYLFAMSWLTVSINP